MDVAADVQQNAFVLDLNSGPSFYHNEAWPGWFVAERSAMIRSAADIVQQVAARKLEMRRRRLGRAGTGTGAAVGEGDLLREPLGELGGWSVLYREDSEHRPLPPKPGILGPNECVRLFQEVS